MLELLWLTFLTLLSEQFEIDVTAQRVRIKFKPEHNTTLHRRPRIAAVLHSKLTNISKEFSIVNIIVVVFTVRTVPFPFFRAYPGWMVPMYEITLNVNRDC